MDKIRKKKKRTLKKSFIGGMLVTAIPVVALSVLTVMICLNLQKQILPDSNTATLRITTKYEDGTQETRFQRMQFGEKAEMPQSADEAPILRPGIPIQEYSIDKIDNGLSSLSPNKQKVYLSLSALMVFLPALYTIIGIICCAVWFYRRKLYPPIRVLSDAAEQIANRELDFTVASSANNELGALCDSFETMRQALYENNRRMLRMMEERRMLQSSVAHDLRNPISIIEGYTEYISHNIDSSEFTKEKLSHMISNIDTSVKRLTQYTNSIQDIYKLEDLEIERKEEQLPDVINKMLDDFVLLAENNGLTLDVVLQISKRTALLDMTVLYRILENIITNSLRFARSHISIHVKEQDSTLTFRIADDGCGFREKDLNNRNKYSISTNSSDNHMGMGLIVSRILCRKHGGSLNYYNSPDGGAVSEVCICAAKPL